MEDRILEILENSDKALSVNEINDSLGFTTVDEKTKRDIKKSMDIVSYDWVNSDEN